jgi:hypothetical protein
VGLIWTWFIHRGIFQLHVWLPGFRGDEKCIAGDIRELIPKRPLQSLTLQSALSYAASWCLNFSGNLLHRVSQQLVRKWLVLFNFTRNIPRLCCEADLVSNTFLNQARFALKAAGWPRRGRSGWWSDIYLSLSIYIIHIFILCRKLSLEILAACKEPASKSKRLNGCVPRALPCPAKRLVVTGNTNHFWPPDGRPTCRNPSNWF